MATEGLGEDFFSSFDLEVDILHIDDCAEVVVSGDARADLVFEVVHFGNMLDGLVVEALPVSYILLQVGLLVQFPCFIIVKWILIPVAGVWSAVPTGILGQGAPPGVSFWGEGFLNDRCMGLGGCGSGVVCVVFGVVTLSIGHEPWGSPSGSWGSRRFDYPFTHVAITRTGMHCNE